MKVLITGINGFVASHLARSLLNKGHSVIGTYRWTEDDSRIKSIKDKMKLVPADLLDFVSLFRVIADNKPEVISHLAAQSYVPDSFDNPIVTIETNTIGTVNLLEVIRTIRDYIDKEYNPVIHVCSSSEVYGKVDENEIPITENNQLRPGNPYAIGKIGADRAAYFYNRYYGLKIITTRMFTHTGWGRTMQSAECNFARQIVYIKKENLGKGNVKKYNLYHGNLDSVRTWANVKDAVEAYINLFESGKSGEFYNIGGDTRRTIGEMLDYMISLSPCKSNIVKVQDPKLMRKMDVNLQIVDTSKFKRDVNWTPKISFEETIKDVLDYWRKNEQSS